jgi:hypothetical protein
VRGCEWKTRHTLWLFLLRLLLMMTMMMTMLMAVEVKETKQPLRTAADAGQHFTGT